MTRSDALKAAPRTEQDGDLNELIALVIALSDLIADENMLLARGMPASVSQNVVRKAKMSAELDAWLARIRSGDESFVKADRSLHKSLVDQLKHLQDEMGENMNRLRRAMSVTHRRIDAIMSAVREQSRVDTGYGRDGNRAGNRDRPITNSVHMA